MKEHGIYLANEQYYSILKELGSLVDYQKERPLMYALPSKEHKGLYFLIPITTLSTTKKRQRIESFMQRKGISSSFYEVGNVAGRHVAFKISGVLPVTEKYVREWTIKGEHYIVQNKNLLSRIEQKLKHILSYENQNPNRLEQRLTDIQNRLVDELKKEKQQDILPNNVLRRELKNMNDDNAQTDIQSLLAERDTSKLSNFLKEQIVEYKNSEMFKNYLDFVAKCPRYSNRNIRFLIKQKPDIGRVGTFTKWKEQGLHIKKGSKGYKIFMPIIKDKYENGKLVLDEKGKKVREVKGFKLGTVFEDKQLVEYEQLPKPVEYLNQDPKNTKDLFMALSEVSEVKVNLKPLEIDGYYSTQSKEIFINSKLHGADLIHTLIHEMTHSKLHENSTASFGDKTYSLQELEAESTAYIVANKFDIDTSKYTIGYLNSWGLDKISSEELQTVMENIQKTANTLIEKIDIELDKRKSIEPKKTTLQNEIEKAKSKQEDLLKKQQETKKMKPKMAEKVNHLKEKFKGKEV